MADGVKIDTVRSTSSGVLGRSLNTARTQHFILDSPSGPNEAVTNGEAFLAGISSCGVTLIEKYAADNGIPLQSMQAVIEGRSVVIVHAPAANDAGEVLRTA